VNTLFWPLILALLIVSTNTNGAEAYPVKPVRLLSPYPTGGGPDIYLRPLAAKLVDLLGQPVLVENRPGGVAGGISSQMVAKATPDGYSLLTTGLGQIIVKHLQSDALGLAEDFVPVARISRGGATVLVVRSDSTAKEIGILIERLKSNPGKFSYASGGIGTPAHLAAAAFLGVTGTQAVHIPFKGGGDMITAMLRGDVEFAMPALSFAIPQIKSGKLRALGIASEEVSRDLPGVPALPVALKSELMAQDSWQGLFAPMKTPDAVLRRLHAAIVKALSDPALMKQIEIGGGGAADPSRDPDDFATFVRRESERWQAIVKVSGAKAD
jgi:tripartite-type tricarboxylate transporter receptor subunit TctC